MYYEQIVNQLLNLNSCLIYCDQKINLAGNMLML